MTASWFLVDRMMKDISEKAQRVLVVSCHPLEESLCGNLTAHVIARCEDASVQLTHLDLYASGFDPVLSASERRGYFTQNHDASAVRDHSRLLEEADILILVFPVWWFGFPAMLKGWFDRVWAPGIAYEHGGDAAPIKPRLSGLKHCVAVTTMGSPWWVDRLVMGRPVRKILRRAIVGACASHCDFQMACLYQAQAASPRSFTEFARRVDRIIDRIL